MDTASDLTAYPRLKTTYSRENLMLFAPEEHEVALAQKVARLPPQQLAFVVMLKCFQNLSYFPAVREVPPKLVDFIARSMGVPPKLPLDYESRRTVYVHAQIIRENLGYQRYEHHVARKLMRTAMYREAWYKDDITDLINIGLAELNKHHYELPAFKTVDQVARRMRTAVNREIGRKVMDGIGPVGRALIDDLLARGETSWWQRLKEPPPRASVKNLADHLEYREWLDGMNVGAWVLQEIPLVKVEQFAAIARQCDAARMREFISNRRYAMVAALLYMRAAEARDETADMYIRQARRVEGEAEEQLKKLRTEKRDLEDELQARYLEVLKILAEPGAPEETVARITAVAAPKGIEQMRAELETLTAYAGNNFTSFVHDGYKRNRPAFLRLLRELRLTSVDHNKRLEGAVQFVLENQTKRAELISPFSGAIDMLPAHWRRTVIRKVSGMQFLDRRQFEAFLFTHVVDELKAGNAVVPGSLRYADFRDQLVTLEEYEAHIEQYGKDAKISVNPREFILCLQQWLCDLTRSTDEHFPENTDVHLNANHEPVIKRIKPRRPSERVARLQAIIAERMPRVDLLDLLTQTHYYLPWTKPLEPTILGFENKLERPTEVLIANVFARGCNLGPTHAAAAISELFSDDEVFTRQQVGYADNYHVTPQRLQEVNRLVLNEYNRYPLPQFWGTGETASVDGTMQVTYENSLESGYHHRYRDTGVVQYQMVSDKYIVLFSNFIPCSVWEAMELIQALMENNSDIQPRVIHGDTQAQTATAFGLCKLLGVELKPRIRNWKGLKLLRPHPDNCYQHIDTLFSAESVNWDLIETHLPDMLRTVLSVRMGRLSPELLRRTLTTFGARNHLNQALAELGRAVRTGYLMTWLSSREVREEVHRGTNKSESTHAYRDFLAFGGEVVKQKRSIERQKSGKYAMLVANLVALYNVVHMTAILDDLHREKVYFTNDDLTFLSAYIHKHINRFGRYRINLGKRPKVQDLEALHGGFLSHHQPPEVEVEEH